LSAKIDSRHSPVSSVPSRPPTAPAPDLVVLNWSGVPLRRSSSKYVPDTNSDASGETTSSARPLKVAWRDSASMSIEPRRDSFTTM